MGEPASPPSADGTDSPGSSARDFWAAVFGDDAPVEIEIGSGDGRFLIASARRHPRHNFLGFERSPAKAKRLEERLAGLAAANVRVLQADATCVVACLFPAASVEAYHVYFPDPWPKRRHGNRRIFRASFVAGLARTLRAGGRVYLATDVAGYSVVAHAQLAAEPGLLEVASGEDHPGLTTSFARKYRAAGRALYAFTFERRVDDVSAQALAASKMRSM